MSVGQAYDKNCQVFLLVQNVSLSKMVQNLFGPLVCQELILTLKACKIGRFFYKLLT